MLQHLLRDLEPRPSGKRVPGDNRTHALDPEDEVVVRPPGERLDADRKPVTRCEEVRFPAALDEQPREVGAVPALRDLLRSETVLPAMRPSAGRAAVTNTTTPRWRQRA